MQGFKAGFDHGDDDDALILKQFESEKLVKPIEGPPSFDIQWPIEVFKSPFDFDMTNQPMQVAPIGGEVWNQC